MGLARTPQAERGCLGYAFYRLAVAEAPVVPRYRHCAECETRYLGASSAMESLCPACAERLFGYPR